MENLQGLTTLKIYQADEKKAEEMDEEAQNFRRITMKVLTMQLNSTSVMDIVAYGGAAVGMIVAIQEFRHGNLGFSGAVTIILLASEFFIPLRLLGSFFHIAMNGMAASDKIFAILDLPEGEKGSDILQGEEIPKKTDDIIPDKKNSLEKEKYISSGISAGRERSSANVFSGAEAQSVTFAYENEIILDDYSLKLEPGRITGIHGASGSGKSTLLKLLMRFWDVNQGILSVDGEDVRKILTKHLRDMESYVMQETYLFHDSIAKNIAVGKPGVSMEEIIEAAKKASIHDLIMKLPKGYDTNVGELGDTLSGGEKQRIGIARAFLHDSHLLLMDEPTSNLDSLNEGIILRSLREVSGKKTVVLVSHRKSTMNVADQIFEMKNSRLS